MSGFQSSKNGKDARVLDGLVRGTLRPQVTLLSDTVVQPALRIFRELLRAKLARNEAVLLVCTEIDPTKLLDGFSSTKSLKIIDCLNDSVALEDSATNTKFVEIDDIGGLGEAIAKGSKGGKTTLFLDSLNTLEAFNPAASIFRLLKQHLQRQPADSDSLVTIYHTDVPSAPSSSSNTPLLPSLLSPSFASSLVQLTLHPPSLLSHLHYAYSLESVGQHPHTSTDDLDVRLFEYLPLLHSRAWGSPLHPGEASDVLDITEDSSYDSPNAADTLLDLLSAKDGAARTALEYRIRGMNRNGRKSEAAKISRGLEGCRRKGKELEATDVSEVLRIKRRRATLRPKPADKQAKKENLPSEPTEAAAMFNLSLTDRQREARETTALPYTPKDTGEIIYQPDSADDVDESDPDEDLDL